MMIRNKANQPRSAVQQRRRGERGLSLIEASMVLALAAVVIGGAVAYYQTASQRSKNVATNGAFQTVVSTVDSLYSSKGNYEGLTTKFLATSGALPAHLADRTAGKIRSPHGGNIEVTGNNDRTFTVKVTAVQSALCNMLGQNDFGTNLVSLNIGSKPVASPSDVESACSGEDGKTDAVEMAWILR